MKVSRFIWVCCYLLLSGCVSLPKKPANTLDGKTLDLISNTVFEVVALKPEIDSLSYEKPLPLELIPFSVRNDKYVPLGTAFAINEKELVTAAHVLALGVESQNKGVFLRDRNGNVYGIDKIFKYSNPKDFVVFSARDFTAKRFLDVNISPELNRKVYAVGNALGEGVVIRDGLFTSTTPEARSGAWKWLRFSAAASPGNSGGPLLDQDGKVIGVVLQKSANENLNVALPINEVLGAKEHNATLDKVVSFSLPNAEVYVSRLLKKEIKLPMSSEELGVQIRKLTGEFRFELAREYFESSSKDIFPNGKGSMILLNQSLNYHFPSLITRREDGNWMQAFPDKIQEADIGNNGHFAYGVQSNTLIVDLREPSDVSLEKLLGDSKLFMDLILKGISFSRKVGTEKTKITSMGKAVDEYMHTDFYGRKWLVRTWPLEYSDELVVTLSLPSPGGFIALVKSGPTESVYSTMIPDLKFLTNFIHMSYEGTLKEWQEFLSMPKYLPAVFSTLNITFDYGQMFSYSSRRFEFSISDSVLKVSEKEYLSLLFDYYKDYRTTTWDVSGIALSEGKGTGDSYYIFRRMRPPSKLRDKYQDEWSALRDRKFPYNRSIFFKDQFTAILAAADNEEAQNASILYGVGFSCEGKKEQSEVESKLNWFRDRVEVFEGIHDRDQEAEELPEELLNEDLPPYWEYMAPSDMNLADYYVLHAQASYSKGDNISAIKYIDRAIGLNPYRASSFFLRGDIRRKMKIFDAAAYNYRKAVELAPNNITMWSDYIRFVDVDRKDYSEAASLFRKAIDLNPQDAGLAGDFAVFTARKDKDKAEVQR